MILLSLFDGRTEIASNNLTEIVMTKMIVITNISKPHNNFLNWLNTINPKAIQ